MLGTLAVAPMIFCEAFVPSARRLFWKPQRFPIADAHYAMGFALLAGIHGEEKYHQRAVHFLEVLKETRCRVTKITAGDIHSIGKRGPGRFKEGTPLITTVPYAYEAFSQVYAIDADPKWLRIMQSIASMASRLTATWKQRRMRRVAVTRLRRMIPCGVVNASAYRAFLLTKAGIDLSEPALPGSRRKKSEFRFGISKCRRLLVLLDGWHARFCGPFSHCFVLKALAKIEQLTGSPQCRNAIERGVNTTWRTWSMRTAFRCHSRKAAAAHGIPERAI